MYRKRQRKFGRSSPRFYPAPTFEDLIRDWNAEKGVVV